MKPAYTRIASPLSALQPHYTVVVVGSGYGAGVAASRLARAGQSVAVLERGREIAPGDYPNDMATAAADLQANGMRGPLGPEDGLYEVHLNPDMLAVVGCGLGGTSLINANVALDMDPRLFKAQGWPAVFRADENRSVLQPYADRAREMLGVNPYPETHPPLNKMLALQKAAREMKAPFKRTPIAVNFSDCTNPVGVPQPACNNCGDCTSGCNVGAKNTTLMNYLPDARRHGAQVFTGARVTHVARDGERWRVHVQPVRLRGTADADWNPAPVSVTADVVVLGAGALGSTEILLRSKDRGLPLSDRLGSRFSGNGDVLAWGYDNAWNVTTTKGKDGQDQAEWHPIHGIGAGSNTLDASKMPGPCITGVIDLRGNPEVRRGLVVEEGVIPGALATMMGPALFFADALLGGELRYGTGQAQTRLEDAQLLGNAVQNDPGSLTALAYEGPVARTQTYLVMSVDEAAGTLRLVDDRVRIDWPGAGSSPVIARDNAVLQQVNDACEGLYVPNPLWQPAMGNKIVTVHPLGGCGMADHAQDGVVDSACRVFKGTTGIDVHDGLYVFDGSVMPGPVGVNPLLTICAVAERAVEQLCTDYGWTIDFRLQPRGPLPPPGPAPAPAPHGVAAHLKSWFSELGHEAEALFHRAVQGVEDDAIEGAKHLITELIAHHPEVLSPSFQFTEQMHGWVDLESLGGRGDGGQRMASDYAVAAAWGRARGNRMDFTLTIRTDDLVHFVADPSHAARITGTVTCPALSPEPMTVASGVFHLLPIDPDRVETWTMTYEMVLQRAGASRLRFAGHKVVHQTEGSSPWTDTTTLFVKVHDADAPSQPVVAMGQLTLDLEDLARQAMTIQLDPPSNLLGKLEAKFPMARAAISKAYAAKFAGLFGGVLFRAYGGLLADLSNFPATDPPPPSPRTAPAPRPAPMPAPLDHQPIRLKDGFSIRLTRYAGGRKGPVLLAPGFSVCASSFAADTVQANLVDALMAAGYDVWLLDYRASADSGSPVGSGHPYSIDDIALVDWPAAVEAVRRATGAPSVQVVAHCVGSMSLLMALLRGLEGVRSVIASQLTLHPVTTWLNEAKADLNLATVLDHMDDLHGQFDSVAPPPQHATMADHRIDVATWGVPVPDGEACKNPVCRRVFSFFGASYTHAQLNAATHSGMGRWFGPVSLSPFEQLTLIMKAGHVVDRHGDETYLQRPLAQAGLALPITFIAGARNQIFLPETSLRTQAWLKSINPGTRYERRVFDDYAHMDHFIGRRAAQDVFPYLVSELERYPAG